LKGQIKQEWAKLTENEIDPVSGERDELVGLI
jgi:uncharacterized protein YjbJ (UPF0337 family)